MFASTRPDGGPGLPSPNWWVATPRLRAVHDAWAAAAGRTASPGVLLLAAGGLRHARMHPGRAVMRQRRGLGRGLALPRSAGRTVGGAARAEGAGPTLGQPSRPPLCAAA